MFLESLRNDSNVKQQCIDICKLTLCFLFIILTSMLLSFIPYFLNWICLFSCFLFGGVFPTIITRFFISTFSHSTSSSSHWIHVWGLIILWNKASWHWAMACRNWEFQWPFPWCNYEIRTKLAQHHFKSKPSASSYMCTTISVHF